MIPLINEGWWALEGCLIFCSKGRAGLRFNQISYTEWIHQQSGEIEHLFWTWLKFYIWFGLSIVHIKNFRRLWKLLFCCQSVSGGLWRIMPNPTNFMFLAVQDSSIGDLVTNSLSEWVSPTMIWLRSNRKSQFNNQKNSPILKILKQTPSLGTMLVCSSQSKQCLCHYHCHSMSTDSRFQHIQVNSIMINCLHFSWTVLPFFSEKSN